MSRFNERVFALLATVLTAAPAHAQTIGDYSRAQRAVIEASMTRSSRIAADPLPVPLPSLPAPSAPTQARTPTPALPSTGEPQPDIVISGVVVSTTRRAAEVVVDGVPFLLEVGHRVPETSWTVATIEPGKVVFARANPARSGGASSRTFVLPELEH